MALRQINGVKRRRSTANATERSVSESTQESPAQSGMVASDRSTRRKARWGEDVTDDAEREKELEESGESNSRQDDAAEDSSSDAPEKVFFAATCHQGCVGCAYYDPSKSAVYILEDTYDGTHADMIKMVLEQASPEIILTSAKADDQFVDLLRDYADAHSAFYQIRPGKDFLAAKGRDRLLSLGLFSELSIEATDDPNSRKHAASSEGSSDTNISQNAYAFMQRRRDGPGVDPTVERWNAGVRLGSYVANERSSLCMASVGALLDHMVRVRAVGELEDQGITGIDVRAIEVLALHEVMQINQDALFSLQVFDTESHASVHSDKTKEGLSLFGTLNGTHTTLGRLLLRNWLLRPSLSLEVITERHDAVSCFLRPENMITASSMHSHLKGIKNVPRFLSRMKAGKARLIEWQGVVKFTFHMALLYDAASELNQAGNVPIMRKLMATLDIASFKEIGAAVNEKIDWEESMNSARVCVRPHVSEELDNLKHIYHGIDSVLSSVAERVWRTVPEGYVPSLNVVYFPQLGFLICVPLLEEWKGDEGIHVLEGWTFQFSSEEHVYMKSVEMHDLDKHLGDLHSSIVDMEIDIVQALLERVRTHAAAIDAACDVCAELDVLLAFAEASRAYEYRRPVMVVDNVIEIKGGRHPLQEQAVDTFVPNDLYLRGGNGVGYNGEMEDGSKADDARPPQNSVLICTGANACGKSIYLKQTALIQIMAQVGCFVPAESAILGVTDKIFTRIQTRESVSKVQSAFMIDLNAVSLALRNCTARSLLLMDEFGKGTVSTDGAGLFCGLIKHLLNRGYECPKTLAATHFHEVFDAEFLDPETAPVTFVHMQVLLTSVSGQLVENDATPVSTPAVSARGASAEHRDGTGLVRKRITYLYQVAPGLALDSHAARCAEMCAIPQRIVERAEYVAGLVAQNELGELLDEDMPEKEREELEQAEGVCRRLLEWNIAEEEEDCDVKQKLAEVLGVDLSEVDMEEGEGRGAMRGIW